MNHGAMAMPMTFTSSTTVTLFFEKWTTTYIWTYLLTLLLLSILAFLNRFLAALRFQIEHRPQASDHVAVLAPPRTRISKARLSPLPRYIQIDNDEIDAETWRQGESCHGSTNDEEGRLDPQDTRKRNFKVYSYLRRLVSLLPKWTPNAPRNWRHDGSRALLEGVRAFIGYILMLAVMTFNVGVLCAVLGGIIVGEVVLGRYMRVSGEMSRDGACHE
ncbi:copper transporter family protein [Aspergillus stella-maris]|uniref:copper transporter family protein n=1 Tax=Aspergillus stella-maris TaxID=1810926 RepID=UPI003CCE2526